MWNLMIGIAGALISTVVIAAFQGLSPLNLLHVGSLLLVSVGVWVAVGVAHSPFALAQAFRTLGQIRKDEGDLNELVEEVVRTSERVRKEGVLSIDSWKDELEHPVWRQLVSRLAEGIELPVHEHWLRRLREEREAQVIHASSIFGSAGQFAPGAGVIGAVLGLMQVMQKLEDPSLLGPGLVASFTAILYGLILSTWVFLPLSRRAESLISGVASDLEICELGIRSVTRGESPQVLKDLLSSWTKDT